MLALTRKPNQSIIIGDDIEVTIVEVRGEQVRLGIAAPKEIPIYRREIYEENRGDIATVDCLAGKMNEGMNQQLSPDDLVVLKEAAIAVERAKAACYDAQQQAQRLVQQAQTIVQKAEANLQEATMRHAMVFRVKVAKYGVEREDGVRVDDETGEIQVTT